MENGSMSFSPSEGIDVTATNFDALISYIEHNDNVCFIKDKNHKFAYMNKVGFHYFDLPQQYNVEGRIVGEMPIIHSEYQDLIHTAEDNGIAEKKTVPSIFNTIYGGKNKFLQRFKGEQTALIKDNEPIGVIIVARKLELFTMDDAISTKAPETIQFGNPSELFNDREFEIIFYMLQRLSAKEIAEKFFKSYRTIQNDIQNIYDKTRISGTDARKQFIDWCRDKKGYDRYVPEKFLRTSPIEFFG